jgi:nicotinamidase-related amidase
VKDPLTLLMPARPELTLEPERTALLIIDLNGKDAHPDYGVGRLLRGKGVDASEYYDRITDILPRIRKLWGACKQIGVPVIHLRVAARTTDSRDMNKAHQLLGPLLGWSPVGSPEWEFLAEAQPGTDEIVVNKTSTSVFSSTAIDQLLRNMGVECLIATGGATDLCVGYSVRDAADRGYRVIMVSDCTAAFTRETHEEALEGMDWGLIWVKTLDETLETLGYSDQDR